LQHLPLSPADQRVLLPSLLGGCSVEELERFAGADLPRTWFAHALCHGVLRPETRAHAITCLHEGDDVLILALWEHFEHLADEEQRRAILAALFPPDDAQGPRFLSRFLRTCSTMRAETLEWLLDSLKAWKTLWHEFWSRDDHCGRLLELLRGLGLDASRLWERLFDQIDAVVLLPGSSYQQLLLMNLAAVRDRPGPSLPPAVAQAINDWVSLREHFENAAGVPESTRRAIIDACNRRFLDPITPLSDYFDRFIAPQGTRPEVVDDFTAFFHSFYLAGCEHRHYSSRLLGWLRVASRCSDDVTRAALQQHYLDREVPVEFRWQLAEEANRAGLLLPEVFERVPKPTRESKEREMDFATKAALGDEVLQLTGALDAGAAHAPPLRRSIRSRGPWLAASLAAGLAAVFLFGSTAGKSQLANLALFVPALLLFVDGITQQSVGMKVRFLRRGLPALQSLPQQLRREFTCGLCLGIGGGLILAAVVLLWAGSWRFAACLAIATMLASGLSAALGLLLPWFLHEIPARPWMAAGPLARLLAAASALAALFVLGRFFI